MVSWEWWVCFNSGTMELLIRADFFHALLGMEENWEKDLLKGVIRTSLRTWLLPNEMLSSWELREAGNPMERLLFSLLFSLVVSHVCQCSYVEVKGFQVTCPVFLVQSLQDLMIGRGWIICCWMNDSSLDACIHSFISTMIYWACTVPPALHWFAGVGLGGGGISHKVCWTFRGPGNFPTLRKDCFLGFWVWCDILIIFTDENIKGWTHTSMSRSTSFNKLFS